QDGGCQQRSSAAPEELTIRVIEDDETDERVIVVLDEVPGACASGRCRAGQRADERDHEYEQLAQHEIPLSWMIERQTGTYPPPQGAKPSAQLKLDAARSARRRKRPQKPGPGRSSAQEPSRGG